MLLPQMSPGFRLVRTKNKPDTGEPAAHVLTYYRCFLPDLAGFAGLRRAGPMPDFSFYQRKLWKTQSIALPTYPNLMSSRFEQSDGMIQLSTYFGKL